MRHRKAHRRLCRTGGQRKALLKNLAISLFENERIHTTLPRAKELRPFAEKLITTAKQDTLHARRLVARVVPDRDLLTKLFSQLAPRFAERPGGYTRILKLGFRQGDSAEMALIELVGADDAKKKSGGSRSGGRKLVQRDSEGAGSQG
jgi:large subunit ribosomal protein L17